MVEVWKDIKGYEGFYQVSNLGRVKTLERQMPFNIDKSKNIIKKEKILKPGKRGIKRNYLSVVLRKNSKQTNKYVHRLVAEAFIPNPNNYKEVNHIDENTFNNCEKNLEWCNTKYNINYGERTQKATKKLSKAVIQYDLQSKFIKEWCSIRNASRNLNINIGTIIRCCKGEFKTAGGYIWKYKRSDNKC